MSNDLSPAKLIDNIKQKFQDAILLIDKGRFANGIYLLGYCNELALKYSVAIYLDWPDYKTSGDFRHLKSHDLDYLLEFTGRHAAIRRLAGWSVVSNWSEAKRYTDPSSARDSEAADMILATKQVVEALCPISL